MRSLFSLFLSNTHDEQGRERERQSAGDVCMIGKEKTFLHPRTSLSIPSILSTMTSVASALAALAASAADPESLASAIQGAAFLDATPGDARQQLRGMKERGWSTSRAARAAARASSLTFSLSLSPLPFLSRPRPPPEDPGGRRGESRGGGGPAGRGAVALCQGGKEGERRREKRGARSRTRLFSPFSFFSLLPFHSPTTPPTSSP